MTENLVNKNIPLAPHLILQFLLAYPWKFTWAWKLAYLYLYFYRLP
uniref:Uncharacterized protein n=1 Tax=Tetranychus urticae TaxID=32264 RepID=T1K120_TETUR